jgi:hypothetical protein
VRKPDLKTKREKRYGKKVQKKEQKKGTKKIAPKAYCGGYFC